MAIAFALLNPNVASVLFGATTPDQVAENLSAVDLRSKMDTNTAAELRQIGVGPS
jgi:aryl-alcohol dehydrogenase-like predicted oxidoreductase